MPKKKFRGKPLLDAILLTAAGELTDEEIAGRVGVTVQVLLKARRSAYFVCTLKDIYYARKVLQGRGKMIRFVT
jgi:hypothetical protein